jgi:asparagine synthase (glutamine-hydrolysing)
VFRYLALTWDAADRAESEQAAALIATLRAGGAGGVPGVERSPGAPWQLALDLKDLKVFCSGEWRGRQPVLRPLANRSGVVVGTLFRRCGDNLRALDVVEYPPVRQLDRADTDRIMASRGRALIEKFWGNYVAFLRLPESDARCVVKDPMGPLDCFTARCRGVYLFFSSLEGRPALDLLEYSVDWEALAVQLSTIAMETRATALNEVSRVVRGECVQIERGAMKRTLYWNPLEIARTEPIRDPDRARRMLREVTRGCVQAWASEHEHILHMLSGGLDSSIVLGCLRDAPARPGITCINKYYSEASLDDERRFARLVAEHCGIAFRTHPDRIPESLDGLSGAPKYPDPYECISELTLDPTDEALARQFGATARFDGAGGDQVFDQTGAENMLADYLYFHPPLPMLRPGAWSALLDCAAAQKVLIWRVLHRSMRRAAAGRRPRDLIAQECELGVAQSLVDTRRVDAARRVDLLVHPWFGNAEDAPPGKTLQLAYFAVNDKVKGPFASPDDAIDISPLLSLPLVELVLRIPTYVLVRGGRDRSLARQAFAADLPGAIIDRCSKGTPNVYWQDIARKHSSYLRERLMEGQLAQHGLIDRSQTESALSGLAKGHGSLSELLILTCAEVWLQHWRRGAVRRAAAA